MKRSRLAVLILLFLGIVLLATGHEYCLVAGAALIGPLIGVLIGVAVVGATKENAVG